MKQTSLNCFWATAAAQITMGNAEADHLMSPGQTETDGPSRTDTDHGWTVHAKIIGEETTSALSSASPGGGQGQVFFGEDIGGCNTGNFTNATSTRDEFFSFLDPEIFTETFEDVTGNAPQNLAFGGNLNATLNQGYTRVGAAFGRCPISGTKYWETKAGMTLSFSVPVAAFGFFGTDFGDFGGSMNITTISDNGTVRKDYNMGHTIGSEGSTDGAVLYWGVIDTHDPFTSVEFLNILDPDDVFGFDNLTVGTVSQVLTPTRKSTKSNKSTKSGKSAKNVSGEPELAGLMLDFSSSMSISMSINHKN